MTIKIGFLGYGKMAGAISEGLSRRLIPYDQQIISDGDPAAIEKGQGRGVAVAADNLDAARRAKTLVLAVKPQYALKVLEEIKDEVSDGHLIISVAAGLKLERLRAALTKGQLVRTMPNIAALAGCGAILMCAEPGARKALETARNILEPSGLCLEMDENLFDAATAVSGSGPAYFFMIMEAMVRGAVRLGLPYAAAKSLVVQTALGAAETARLTTAPGLSELRDMVTSPGGTTAAALHVLEEGALNGLIQSALAAAADKSAELGAK